MHPYDPQQPPYHQPPLVHIHQQPNRAATVGIWVLVAWFVGPFLLLLLCCAGCIGLDGIATITGGSDPTPAVSSSP